MKQCRRCDTLIRDYPVVVTKRYKKAQKTPKEKCKTAQNMNVISISIGTHHEFMNDAKINKELNRDNNATNTITVSQNVDVDGK